jgi:hypothetical protein
MVNCRLFPLLLVLSLGSTSCWFRKPPRAFVPPPAQARPVIIATPPEVPAAPEIDAEATATLPSEVPGSIMPPAPPPPPSLPPARRPATAAAPRTTPPPAPTPEPPPLPKLGQIFTAAQLREYNQTLDQSLERVRKVLAIAAGKNLNADQSETVNRIQTFQKQAEQAREQDLVTAVNLARRADLLARDLLERLP